MSIKNKIEVLVDLLYKKSMNDFEYWYGETVTYHEIEQESYIDMKEMLSNKVGSKFKVKKMRLISTGNTLTCRLIMSDYQYQKFISIYENRDKELKFVHNFGIESLREYDPSLYELKTKKNTDEDDE